MCPSHLEPSEASRDTLAAIRGLTPVTRRYAVSDVEVRAHDDGSTLVDFYGHANTTGKGYEMYGGPDKGGWTEFVDRGAAKKTLSENPDVAFLINHTGMTLARTTAGTLTLAEDKVGLEVKATLDTRVTVVNDLAVLMEARNMDEMSFAFRVVKQNWLDGDGEEVPWWDMAGIERHIVEYSLQKGDVSVVNYGANPYTDAALRGITVRDFAGALGELRGNTGDLSSTALATLHTVLDLIAGADTNVDEAQEVLSGLMGVPNPDSADGDTQAMGAPASGAYYIDLAHLHSRRQANQPI